MSSETIELIVKRSNELSIQDLAAIANTCEEEGRYAQALLLRGVIADIEAGSPWLELMNGGLA